MNTDLIAKMRLLEEDHTPDGYPAVTMSEISQLVDIIENLKSELALYKAALTKAVSLPMGQLPHESGRYYAWMNGGQVVVVPDRYRKGE
ncbi:MAG TPA: hypothetical protein DCR95_11530 [Desulfobacter sp.]|nr:hypothetical protein [Desulfobacter sp.]